MKPRLLVVDHNACRPPQQRPYELLAGHFDVCLVVPRRWQESHSLVEASLTSTVQGLQIKALAVGANGRYHRSWFKGLGAVAAQFGPDLMWIHAEPENVLAWQGEQIRRRHCPGAAMALVSWRNIDYPRGSLPYRFAWLYQWLEDFSRKTSPLVLCYNRESADILGRRGFRCAPTRMGVNVSAFKPGPAKAARRKLGLGLAPPVAGFAGRCLEEKGVADLIEALARLGKGSLLLLGDGPARPHWERMAGERGVAVQSLALPHDQVPLAFQCMDCLVLPSRTTAGWKEQFGRALIEAMACGVPVVGSDSGAIPVVLGARQSPRPGKPVRAQAGMVFHEGDAGGLSRALAQAFRPEQRRVMVAGGKRRARYFQWEQVVKDLVPVFKAEIRRQRKQP